MSRRSVAMAVGVLIGSLLLAVPAAAAAADSCTFSAASGDVTLSSDAGFNSDGVNSSYLRVRRSGETIEFTRFTFAGDPQPTQTAINCTPVAPTVTSADSISITMTHPENPYVFISTFDGALTSTTPSSIDFAISQAGSLYGGTLAVAGSNGADTLVAGTDGVNLDGDAQADLTFEGTTDLVFQGWGGNDQVSLNGGNGTGPASALPGIINAGAGDDVVRGGTGADLLAGGPNNDKVYGGDGDDFLGAASNYHPPGEESDAGNDRFFGQAGLDTISGDLGNDILDGGLGEDNLYGHAGVDTVTYAAAPAAVRASIDNQANDGVGGATEGDTIRNDVENITGSPFADVLNGRTGTANIRNVLTGGGGNDTLNGLDGSDVLNGGPGTNTINGGPGGDQLNGGPARDVMTGGTGADVGKGGAGNDSISGNDGADVLYGQDGNDALNGGGQIDTCYGGTGTNTLNLCEEP